MKVSSNVLSNARQIVAASQAQVAANQKISSIGCSWCGMGCDGIVG